MEVVAPYLNGLIIALLAFIVSVVFCGVLYSLAVKWRMWLLIGFLLLFALGCGVYLSVPPDSDGMGVLERSLEAVNNSISSFFPSRGTFSKEADGIRPGWQSVVYWIFHFASTLYVMIAVVVLFGVERTNRMMVWFRVSVRRLARCLGFSPVSFCSVNVFWGDSKEHKELATALASSERMGGQDNPREGMVFVVTPAKWSFLRAKDDDSIAAIARRGWKWIFGSPQDITSAIYAQRHFFMGANGQQNVQDAERLIKKIRSSGKGERVKIYVRIAASADDDILFGWADSCVQAKNKGNRDVEVIVVREESIVARRFMLDFPMYNVPEIKIDKATARVSGDFRMMMIGFGSQGRILMNEMICNGQCLDPSGNRVRMSVDVIDKQCDATGWYEANCPDACSRYNIRFKNIEAGTKIFWEYLKEKIVEKRYNRIVVAMHDDRQNIFIANEIARIYKMSGLDAANVVFARVRDPNVHSYVKSAFAELGKSVINTFGNMADTYSHCGLLLDQWDLLAMKLNKKWHPNQLLSEEEAWREVSFFKKESSRASAFSQRNIAMLCSKEVREKNIETLAETEHLRWMAFHFTRGIRVWHPSEDEIARMRINGIEPTPNAIAGKCAHAALVDYKYLPEIDKLFGLARPLQENDRNFIRSIDQ